MASAEEEEIWAESKAGAACLSSPPALAPARGRNEQSHGAAET